jgi:hypothetical protein
MRHEFAPEAKMSTSHHYEDRRAGLRPGTKTEDRLPIAQSTMVIAALSVLSWAVLISIFVVLRAVL